MYLYAIDFMYLYFILNPEVCKQLFMDEMLKAKATLRKQAGSRLK